MTAVLTLHGTLLRRLRYWCRRFGANPFRQTALHMQIMFLLLGVTLTKGVVQVACKKF